MSYDSFSRLRMLETVWRRSHRLTFTGSATATDAFANAFCLNCGCAFVDAVEADATPCRPAIYSANCTLGEDSAAWLKRRWAGDRA